MQVSALDVSTGNPVTKVNMWKVKSKSRKGLFHIVEYDYGHFSCDCEYYQHKGFARENCSHIQKVQDILKTKFTKLE